MRLLLTIDRPRGRQHDRFGAPGDRPVEDVAIDLSDTATVADVLAAIEPSGQHDQSGLVVARTGQTLSPETVLTTADIRSGDTVGLVAPSEMRLARQGRAQRTWVMNRPAAVLRVLNGPQADTTIEIPFGATTVGRGHDNDVVIDDAWLSRHHAVIHVDDNTISITDQDSTNGLSAINQPAANQPAANQAAINGQAAVNQTAGDGVGEGENVRRVTLLPGKRVLLGSTWIEIDHSNRTRSLFDINTPRVEFNRPPRLVPPFEPVKIVLPEPPEHPQKPRLPYLTALAPVVMAVGFVYSPLLFGGQPNWRYGLFMLFSPLMILASFVERRRGGRSDFKAALARFRENIATTEDQLVRARADERRGRLQAAPSLPELSEAIDQLSPRLWERALDETDALNLRIGLADQPTLTEIVDSGKGPADLRAEMEHLSDEFATVPDVPAVATLAARDGANGGIGLSGPGEFVLPLGYSLVAQVASLHSPAEVLVAALVPESSRPEWEWLKWLPHCPADESPLGGDHLAATDMECRHLLGRLLDLVEQRSHQRSQFSGDTAIPDPAVVVVIVEGVPVGQHELTQLLEEGPRAGVFPLWLSGASRRVPRPLGQVVEVSPDGTTATLAVAGTDKLIPNIAVEPLSGSGAIGLARRLTPIDDVSARFTDQATIPAMVSLVHLLGGVDILDRTEPILANWRGRPKHLAAPVGRTAEGVFTLDIRNDGPHGLVGGTTGAGKSEFLQTWIMSMAAHFSPDTVNFLLVDYKGGAAFKDCSRLPHSVGMVTDLDPAGIRRALISLGAEVRRRELLQDRHNCSSLLDMIDKGIADAPPSLLIVVDEFAALIQEVPEFIAGMVDIAQRGRSLGIHLILATQRPAGVITGQIKANTDLRVALRTADSEDSIDVIESPAAADIERATPGRAISRIGRRRTQFQSAYVGGVTSDEPTEVAVRMGAFDFDGITPLETAAAGVGGPTGATDLERLVDNVNTSFVRFGRPLPRRPWLDPLPGVVDVRSLLETSGDNALTIGTIDRPEDQAQVPLVIDLDQDGSIGILGTSGSGKTVTLRTVAAAAGLSSARPEHTPIVYGFDLAGRGLALIDDLPHVAGVVADDEPERMRRVLSDLELLLDQRARLAARHRTSTFAELRRIMTVADGEVDGGGASEPVVDVERRRILLIDGYPAFHQLFESSEGGRWVNVIRRLILEGRQFGIHVVMSAARRELIYSTIARTIGRWVVLRQISVDDYRNLEVPGDLIGDHPMPGRAIIGRHLTQIALLGDRADTDAQVAAVHELATALRDRGVPEAAPIRLLADTVTRAELIDPRALGRRDHDFEPWLMPSEFRVFLITGPRSSGRTATLITAGLAAEAAANRNGTGGFDRSPATAGAPAGAGGAGDQQRVEVVLFSAKPIVANLPLDWRVVVGDVEAREAMNAILAGDGRRRVVLVDDASALSDLGLPVAQLADLCDGRTLSMIAVLDDTKARSNFDALARTLRAPRFGLLLRPNPIDDREIYGMPLPRVASHLWPAGRGYLINDQTMELIQVAG